MQKILLWFAVIIASSQLLAKEIHYIDSETICTSEYTSGAILRGDPLFTEDFLILHSLLKMVNPISVFEIGTCTGEGTLIIKNAVGDSIVYSIELPLGESSYDLETIGDRCYLPYVQIIGNSMHLNYPDFYPIDAWFIDGAHEYNFVLHETKQALLSHPSIIIWHDADIPEVLEGIRDGFESNEDYLLFRVTNTRIAFSIPLTSQLLEMIQ